MLLGNATREIMSLQLPRDQTFAIHSFIHPFNDQRKHMSTNNKRLQAMKLPKITGDKSSFPEEAKSAFSGEKLPPIGINNIPKEANCYGRKLARERNIGQLHNPVNKHHKFSYPEKSAKFDQNFEFEISHFKRRTKKIPKMSLAMQAAMYLSEDQLNLWIASSKNSANDPSRVNNDKNTLFHQDNTKEKTVLNLPWIIKPEFDPWAQNDIYSNKDKLSLRRHLDKSHESKQLGNIPRVSHQLTSNNTQTKYGHCSNATMRLLHRSRQLTKVIEINKPFRKHGSRNLIGAYSKY